MSDTSAEIPNDHLPVAETREGRVVESLAHIIAISQLLGMVGLAVLILRYNSTIAHDYGLRTMGGGDYDEIVSPLETIIDPSIMLVPVAMALIAIISWGVWTLRPWARRAALAISFVLVVCGCVSLYYMVFSVEAPTFLEADNFDYTGMGEEDDGQILKVGAVLAVFYAIIFGILAMPSVGRVFHQAAAERGHAEERFSIKSDAPRTHFGVDHDVEQL